jgi:hypothetical protein
MVGILAGDVVLDFALMMKISADPKALKKIKPHEYAVRFLLGGAVTVAAGLIAKYCGPVVGGLFLAFPAIFPASATLVEKREREKKVRAGIVNTTRGREAAALDATGAAAGSIGLVGFALVIWKFLPVWPVWASFTCAGATWGSVSLTLWWLRKKHWKHA